MASLADELLNDFEDSGSENGNQQNEFLGDAEEETNGQAEINGRSESFTGMELDDKKEDSESVDEDPRRQNGDLKSENAPDEEETKAKVEKMKLGGVNDVRHVAGLMKRLQPVLEVRPLTLLVAQIKDFGLHL